jgi:serine/threonine protein kinase
MTRSNQCPKCNSDLSPGAAPEGLCPRCLFSAAATSLFDEKGDAAVLAELVGQTIDEKYRIERVLGRGGMGAVYLATHLGTERPVALKVLAPHVMDDQEFVERFRREARAAGRLRHPNIVNVTDFGFAEVDDHRVAYLVMEYLDGMSLADFIMKKRERPLPWIGDVVEQVALAVDEAHRHGVIHRDLKPGNIWLVPDGRGGHLVKVLDFGLAKLREVAEPALAANHPVAMDKGANAGFIPRELRPFAWHSAARITRAEDRHVTDANGARVDDDSLTRVGALLGTPSYMSPEQCRGEALDGRSDVYSLGVIAYEMLTGHVPFTGDVESVVSQHIEREPTPPSRVREKLPKSVDLVVLPSLSKSPDDRPESAGSFARALKGLLKTNAEKPQHVLAQALSLYGRAPTYFALTSVLTGVIPFVLFVAFGAYVYERSIPAVGLPALVLLMVGGWFLSGYLTSALVVPRVASLLIGDESSARVPEFGTIVRRSGVSFLALFASLSTSELIGVPVSFWMSLNIFGWSAPETTLLFLLAFWYMFETTLRHAVLTSSVALLEDRRLSECRPRLRALGSRMVPVTGIREIAGEPILLFLVVGAIASVLSVSRAFSFEEFRPALEDRLVALIAIGCVSALLLNPVLAICSALRYVKARQLGGEQLDDLTQSNDDSWLDPYRWMNSAYDRPRVVGRPAPMLIVFLCLVFGLVAMLDVWLLRESDTSFIGVAISVAVVLITIRFFYHRARIEMTEEFVGRPAFVPGWRTLRWEQIHLAWTDARALRFVDTGGTKFEIQLEDFTNADEMKGYAAYQLTKRGSALAGYDDQPDRYPTRELPLPRR